MSKTLKTKILLRNDTAANWETNKNTVLGKGELAVAWIPSINAIGDPDSIDYSIKLKFGDGLRSYEHLPYWGANVVITGAGNTIVDASVADGVVTLTKGNRIASVTATDGVISTSTTNNVTTVSHAKSGVTANSYGHTSAHTPAFGESFTVLHGTVNDTGHMSTLGETKVTLPTLPSSLVYDVDIANMVTASASLTNSKVILGSGSKGIQSSVYSISTSFSATPSSTAIPVEAAVYAKIKSMLGELDALVLVGSINGTGVIQSVNTGIVSQSITLGTTNISQLTDYSAGWVWKIISAGTISGIGAVQSGDQLVCSSDFSSSYNVSNWFVVQGNVEVMIGATTSAAGSQGLVPAPAIMGSVSDFKYLRNDGTWAVVPTLYKFTVNTSTSAASAATYQVEYQPGTSTASFTVYKMKGADGSNPGYQGLVPAPAATDNNSMLFGDGTWQSILILDGGNSSSTY